MSRLRIFRGEDAAARRTAKAWHDKPAVLSFQAFAEDHRPNRDNPVTRARVLRKNDCCPRCRRSVVEPLELADGFHSRNQLPIPGSATLVGFHCLSCDWEWPA